MSMKSFTCYGSYKAATQVLQQHEALYCPSDGPHLTSWPRAQAQDPHHPPSPMQMTTGSAQSQAEPGNPLTVSPITAPAWRFDGSPKSPVESFTLTGCSEGASNKLGHN
jgi:hypothetical protein